LTGFVVNGYDACVVELEVIQDPAAATVALDPVRSRLLAELGQPASAAAVAARVGLTRQKANYHLNALQSHRLVREAGQRKWGGLTERLFVASAASYVVAPGAMGLASADPARAADRLSASYLIALAARVVQEVSDLVRRAREADKHLATLSIDTEIRFRSAAERAEFSAELTRTVAALAARYHDASCPGGRSHRLIVAAHPTPVENTVKEQQ
jgi:DNA-binding transcriptional ArsR family regulator